MTIEELKRFVRNELHTSLFYRLIRHPDYGFIESPIDGYWVAAILPLEEGYGLDIRYGREAKKAIAQGPFVRPFYVKNAQWVGIRLDDHKNDEVIRRELKRAYELSQHAPVKHQMSSLTKLEQMKKMYLPMRTSVENFYQQALFMKDYTDDENEPVALTLTHFSYHQLTDAQLRYYFTLRNDFRQGVYPDSFTNYIYLYVNEIFNLIDIKSTQDGFKKLKEIVIQYGDDSQVYSRLQGYLEAFSAIYLKQGHGVLKGDKKDHLLGLLDPVNKVSAPVFGDALAAYLNMSYTSFFFQAYSDIYLKMLLEIWHRLDRGYSFFASFVAKRKMELLNLMDGIYFGYPLKSDKIALDGVYLLYRNNRWYIEKYEAYDKTDDIKKVIDVFDQLLEKVFKEDVLPDELESDDVVTDVAASVLQEAYQHARMNETDENDPFRQIIRKKSAEQSLGSDPLDDVYKLYDDRLSEEENFYRQGLFMKDFTCQTKKKARLPYQATYQKLSRTQLQCYFAWRTRLRAHQLQGYDTNYAYLYICEIINDIGIKNEEESLAFLTKMKEHYSYSRELKDVLTSYVILHHMKAYYPSVDRISFYFHHLDPRHLGTDEEILHSLRCIQEDFGKKNPLYYGHEEAIDAMLVHFYRLLAQPESLFYDELLTLKREHFIPYSSYFVYFERRTDDDSIMIGDEVCYRYDSRKQQWFKYDYYERENAILGFNDMFNNIIYEYCHIAYGCSYFCDDGEYQKVKEKIRQYLDQLQLTIKDPQYQDPQLVQALKTIGKIRKVSDSNDYDRFMKQGQMLEKIRLERRPPLIIHDYAKNYDELTDDELLAYLYCRTDWQMNKSITSSLGHRLLSLYATEIINGLGVGDEKEALEILKDIARNMKALNRVDYDYALAHHLDTAQMHKDQEADELLRRLRGHGHFSLSYLVKYLLNRNEDLMSVVQNQKDPAFYQKLISETLLALTKDPDISLRKAVFVHKHVAYQLFNGLIHDPQIDQTDIFKISPIRLIEKYDEGFYYDYWALENMKYYKNIVHNIIAHAQKHMRVKKRLRELKINPQIDKAIRRIIRVIIPALRKGHAHSDQSDDVFINFGSLDKIRQDALVTSEKLMTEQEMIDEPEVKMTPAADDREMLSKQEKDILKLLLAHQGIDDYAAAHHLMASVVIDAINEKLFDEIGDNVIAFDGDQPTVVDDYSDDVKALL